MLRRCLHLSRPVYGVLSRRSFREVRLVLSVFDCNPTQASSVAFFRLVKTQEDRVVMCYRLVLFPSLVPEGFTRELYSPRSPVPVSMA